mmetsp:Transcript_6961/g.10980  ORF Transcript_6961/g.10980 Transcript_6961/m.10980 type:complete len:93 (-) Transcript_6961:1736-2014(-)
MHYIPYHLHTNMRWPMLYSSDVVRAQSFDTFGTNKQQNRSEQSSHLQGPVRSSAFNQTLHCTACRVGGIGWVECGETMYTPPSLPPLALKKE